MQELSFEDGMFPYSRDTFERDRYLPLYAALDPLPRSQISRTRSDIGDAQNGCRKLRRRLRYTARRA